MGQPLQAIQTGKLPSNGEVLRRLEYIKIHDGKSIRESAGIVARELLPFWERACIATRHLPDIIDKVETTHTSYIKLKKNKNRRSKTQIEHEKAFTTSLDNLFDIAHADALETANAEDQAFLKAQREPGILN